MHTARSQAKSDESFLAAVGAQAGTPRAWSTSGSWAFLAFALLFWMAGCSSPAAPLPLPQTTDSPTSALQAASQAASQATSQPTLAPTPTPQAVVVEVTRLVEREVIVTATPTPPTACAPSDPDDADEIVIGSILPLSKPGAVLSGLAMQAALNVGLGDISESGGIRGKPLRLIAYDSAGLPSRGAHYAEQLITEDCASAIVGIYHGNVALTVLDVAERYGVPVVLAEPALDELTAGGSEAVFRIASNASMLGQTDSRWLAAVGDYNGDGRLFAVLLAEDSSAGQALVDQAKTWMPAFEIELQTFLLDLPARDFSSIIARIVDLELLPDAIFVKLMGDPAIELPAQLLKAGIGPRSGTLIVTGPRALNDAAFWQAAPEGDGVVVTRMGPWHTTVTEMGRGFAGNYQQYFNRWPESYAFAAYDSLLLVADAMERSDGIAPAAIIAALERSDIELAAGRYHFPFGSANPPDGVTTPLYMWRQWPDAPVLFLEYTVPNQPAADMAVIWPEVYRTVSGPYVPVR